MAHRGNLLQVQASACFPASRYFVKACYSSYFVTLLYAFLFSLCFVFLPSLVSLWSVGFGAFATPSETRGVAVFELHFGERSDPRFSWAAPGIGQWHPREQEYKQQQQQHQQEQEQQQEQQQHLQEQQIGYLTSQVLEVQCKLNGVVKNASATCNAGKASSDWLNTRGEFSGSLAFDLPMWT